MNNNQCKSKNFYGARCRLKSHPKKQRHDFPRIRRHKHNKGCDYGKAHK
jgi:hypothetical protein